MKQSSSHHAILPVFLPFLGCPEQCSYCDQESVTGIHASGTVPTREEIFLTIAEGLKLFRKKENIEIALYGGSITALPEEVQEHLLKAVWENPSVPKPEIRLSTLPNALSDSTIERLLRYKVSTVELGVQSMEASVLKVLGRRYTPETVLRSVNRLQRAGLNVVAQLMCAAPSETITGFRNGTDLLYNAGVRSFRIYPLVLFENTPLKKAVDTGELTLPPRKESMKLLRCAVAHLEFLHARLIRLSLPGQPSEGEGLRHPALRNFIASQVAEILIRKALKKHPLSADTQHLTVEVPVRRLSEYRGHGKCTLHALQESFPGCFITVTGREEYADDTFSIETEKGKSLFSRHGLLSELFSEGEGEGLLL